MLADPTGVGELLVGVADGRAVCDGLGDRVGEGEVRVGVGAGAVEEELAAGWVGGTGTGRIRM